MLRVKQNPQTRTQDANLAQFKPRRNAFSMLDFSYIRRTLAYFAVINPAGHR